MASSKVNQTFTRDHLFDLKGKVALVTGGGSGIGLMAAQALATNGAKVYVVGRTKEKLDTVVKTFGGDKVSGEIIALQGDVSSKDGIKKLVAEYGKHEKCCCILVNNAGIAGETFEVEASSAKEMKSNLFDDDKATFDDWTSVYSTNVAGIYFLTTAMLPLLRKSTETHKSWSSTVINITSISGMVKSAQHHFAYNASKGAAIHLTRLLAAETANNDMRIRINSIAPGVFPSEMTTDESDQSQKSHIPKEKFEGKVPAQRPGSEEDMASSVLYFASNQYLNGVTLAVDGGYTLAEGM